MEAADKCVKWKDRVQRRAEDAQKKGRPSRIVLLDPAAKVEIVDVVRITRTLVGGSRESQFEQAARRLVRCEADGAVSPGQDCARCGGRSRYLRTRKPSCCAGTPSWLYSTHGGSRHSTLEQIRTARKSRSPRTSTSAVRSAVVAPSCALSP
jgi:hypothetical protein